MWDRLRARLIPGLLALAGLIPTVSHAVAADRVNAGAVGSTAEARAAAPNGSAKRARGTVRASVSNRGAERLGGLRVIRLLEIELGERTPLSPRSTGPLGGDVIWVWIDAPTPRVVLIEVRRFDRPVSRRNLAIKDLAGDVAARLVAIAASEMVRAQARASLVRPPPKPQPGPATTSDSEQESLAAIVLTAAARALWLPGADTRLLGGSELGLAHRLGTTSQQLYVGWLAAPASDPAARMVEVGAGADLRLRLGSPGWRLRLGGRAGAAQLWLPGATAVDGLAGDRGWTARAAATVGVAARLDPTSWLELAVAPGALLHTVEARGPREQAWSLGGFALDTSLGLLTDFGLGTTPARQAAAPQGRGVDRSP